MMVRQRMTLQVKRESETFLSKEEREKYIVHIPLSKKRKVSLPTNDTWQD